MPNEFWVNLPVENLDRSRQFYKEIGFTFHPEYVDRDDTAALLLGDNQVLVMLLPEAAFSTFTGHAPAEVSGTGVEALLSIDVGSRERVHEVIGQAVKAGDDLQRASGPGLDVRSRICRSGWPPLECAVYRCEPGAAGVKDFMPDGSEAERDSLLKEYITSITI